MEPQKYVQELVNQSREAQKKFATFSQEQVDRVVRAAGKAVYDKAEMLARMAVDETGMGCYEDKILKNKGKSKITWYRLKGVKSRGIIRRIREEGLVEVAHPMGVVGAITPTTNPTMTPMHNAMTALKCGNSLLICPHPRSKKTATRTVEVMNEAIAAVGAPENLIQIIPEPTVELSGLVMALCDVCISTGGAAMVNAAYSSGKPAFGVGQGNVQVLLDRDVPLTEMVPMLARGRSYDYGVLCTCEQSVFCPSENYDAMMALFALENAYCVESLREIEALRSVLFPGGKLNSKTVGTRPVVLAAMAGFSVPEDTRLLVVKV
ncbi:MAG: aldehyde dehydrogenase family protein, partial [Syntrophobacteraceae bacterium]|nr:aldehyde dehydrogenase family protein [Desulfobacteraceae bacterium]